MRTGVYVYGLASAAAGVMDLVWREFEPAHQPIQAWGQIPGVTILACIAAVWLIAGGAAMLWRRSERYGAAALAILYGIFVLFPVPRLYTAPHFLGHRADVYIGVLVSVCQQLVLFVAAVIVWKSAATQGARSQRAALFIRWTFGVCPVIFGLAHLTAVQTVVPMIPKWMPLGGAFWTELTGIAFLLSGAAILSGVWDILAAKLLGLMLLVFSVLVLLPMIFRAPGAHVSWGANAYNLTAVGASWIMAGWLAQRQQATLN